MNEENSWLVVPIMLGGMVVVGAVMALLMEYLPQEKDTQFTPVPSVLIFVGGTFLAVAGVTAVVMFIAITRLGCCA